MFCDFFAAALWQSCEITRLPHGCLAAAVRILRFSFPTIKLRTSHDPQGSRTSVAQLPCDVYDIIGPVWIFEKLSAICLRHAAPAKSYVKTVARLKPVSHQPYGSRAPVYEHTFGVFLAAASRPSYVSQGPKAVATSYGEFSTCSFSLRFSTDIWRSQGSCKAASR